VNFPLDIQFKRFTTCVIICLCDKWLPQYVGPYVIEEMVLQNTVKLKLLASIRIYLVVNISKVMRYRELVKEQRVKEPKPVEVDKEEEYEVEKILNKRKV